MAKFRVGEKVRLLEGAVKYIEGFREAKGKPIPTTGVVAKVYEQTSEVRVRLDGNDAPHCPYDDSGGWALRYDQIEPVATLRFAVGDKVVIAGCDQIGYLEACGAKVGDVGVIYEMGGLYDYKIRFDGNRERVALNDAELAPYVEPAKPVAYSVGDRVKVRQAWGDVRTGVVYVEDSDSYKGMTCVRYDDAISHGFDMMRDVEVLEVITPAKPTLLAAGTLVRLTENGAEFVNKRMRLLRFLDAGAKAGDVVEIIENSDDDDELPYRVRLAPDVPSWCRFDSIEPVVPGDFGVGDKVRIKDEYALKWRYPVGRVYVIKHTNGAGHTIDVPKGGEGIVFSEEIELVASNTPIEPYREPAKTPPASEKKREFRVGDKVRVLHDDMFGDKHKCVGKTGVVSSVHPNGVYEYRVRFTSPVGDIEVMPYDGRDLEPVAPTKTIAVSNLRFTRKGERIVVEANGKRVATVSVEELRKMSDEMTKEDVAQ